MRSSHTRFISRIVLLAVLSGALAAPAFAAAVGAAPGGGPGGGAPGGGGPGGGGSSGASGAGGNGTHAYTSARAGGCASDSHGKAAPNWFAWQSDTAPNGQPCSDFRN
jgi:hypothetical protein